MDKVKLFHGDCLELMKDIQDGSIDLVLTDPPYGITDLEWDNEIDVVPFFNSVARVLSRGGRLVCFCQEPFTSRLVTGAIGELRFNYKCAWIKNRPGNAKMAKKAMVSVIEDILIFTEIGRCKQASPAIEAAHSFVESAGLRRIAKILMQTGKYKNTASAIKNVSKKCDRGDSDYYNFFCKSDLVLLDKEIGVPFDIGWYLAEAERDKQSRTPVFNLWEGGKSKRNGLVYSCPSKPVHPTQKPVGLLEDLIKTFSNPSAKVLDCFMGSGSTGVACVNTGRNFIGIELDENYCNIATERIATAQAEHEL